MDNDPPKSRESRKRLFVDPQIQGALLLRCIVNWVYCVAVGAMFLLCWSVVTNPGHPTLSYFVHLWTSYWPVLVASVLLLIIAMMDFVRVSNRFCGPMKRLRHDMRRLARGEHVGPIKFRENDFWQEFATEFNQLVARVQDSPSDPVAGHARSANDAIDS